MGMPVVSPSRPHLPSLLAQALFCSLVLFNCIKAGPMNVEDNFTPQCGSLLADPPPGGWLLWSQAATWPSGSVPGTGGNVTIPCNVGVLLDVAFVDLTVLEIQGALKVKDDPSLPKLNITAAFVVVKGRFIIGSSFSQFKQKVEIRLKPNPNNRANYSFTSPLPAEPAYPRSIGHKAFAVVGGQVDFHGLPGSSSLLTWTRLASTAAAGATVITVKGKVSDWPVGSPIVIAPTDYDPDQEDVRNISSVTCGASTCTLTLSQPLTYNHFAANVSDGFGGLIEEASEVALLTRNIVITGTPEQGTYYLEGGHFIVFMTMTQQFIEGVQFLLMGQQGQLGRYNIHFHVCKEQNNSVIRKNLILHSKQRCVVIHATLNAVVDSNVAYNTSGHCFMIEEGGETGNTFSNNFGLRTRAVTVKIADDETDDRPATFWITNPNNSYIGNAAGGSEDSGFWLELRDAVRGLSLQWAQVNQTVPRSISVVGRYTGNGAHSNLFGGFRMYPHGYLPRYNATVTVGNYDQPVWVELGNFNLWKNNQVGVFIHDTSHVVFSNSTLADNTWGIELNELQGVNLTGHRIVGLTQNYGNPSNCNKTWGKRDCGPITGCSFPLTGLTPGRSVSSGQANQSIFGVIMTEDRERQPGDMVNLVANTTFSGFDNTCHAAAAIAVGGSRTSYWSSGHGFKTVKFSSTTKTNQAFLFPRDFTEGGGFVYHEGEPATMFALRDIDGSLTGSPGYIVANNSAILPPASFSPQCSSKPNWNAFSCPKTCYRTVQVIYDEPGFAPYPLPTSSGSSSDSPRKLGDYSYLMVTRVEDGSTLTLIGNLHQYATTFDNGASPYSNSTRLFPMSLLTGYTYEITFLPAGSQPSFVPTSLGIQYKDGEGCGGGVILRVKGSTPGQYSWAAQDCDITMWASCPGNTAALSSAVLPVPFTYACTSSGAQALQLNLTTALESTVTVTVLLTSGAPEACSSTATCGLTSTSTRWYYNQQNLDLHPEYNGGPAFFNPLYPKLAPDWSVGPGPLGYEGWAHPAIAIYLRSPQWHTLRTYYFATSFNLSKTACYSSLLVDVVVLDGVILYLNNVEILRVNMPDGAIDNMTEALSHTNAAPNSWNQTYKYTSFTIPLNAPGVNFSLAEGGNAFAAEVHVDVHDGRDVGYALKASLVQDTSCSAPKVLTEVCDGVDNNADGKVDIDPATGKLLQRPCWTACGAGKETCINGAYQNCSAPTVYPEACNGRDDNCDGLVDNGQGQLDCPAGSACFAGKCQPVQTLTKPETVWPSMSSGWYYQDKGNDLTSSPSWKKGALPGPNWSQGSASFGIFPENTSWTFNTTLFANSKGNISTRYFIKNFSLPDTASTYGFAVALQRADGAVVYLNGQELFRSNMPNGTLNFTSWASSGMCCTNPAWSCYALQWPTFGPLRAYQNSAVAGTNTLAVELHPSRPWNKYALFDLNLTRYVIQPCPSGVASCVRKSPTDTVFVKQKDMWQFLDASLPLPPTNWASPSFDDSSWLSGPTIIGNSSFVSTNMTTGDGRVTYFFRKTLSIPDGMCYYNLTMQTYGTDGTVVYINGGEAARYNMPGGNITDTTPATTWPIRQDNVTSLSSGWLVNGINVIAVELHRALQTSGDYKFDLGLVGQREGASCTPLPP